jgi:polar amino acid transport system substrate-binding protein
MENVRDVLAPGGGLRAGINMGNALLVAGQSAAGDPIGVSPDVAAEIARRLGVSLEFVCRARPAELVEDSADWDIALIAVEPARASTIAFSAPYVDIDATYLVWSDSPFRSTADLDQPGVRIAVAKGSAYDLWLTRNLRHATVVALPGGPMAGVDGFRADRLEAAAGLRGVLSSVNLTDVRILDDDFTSVGQAVGVPRSKGTGAAAWIATIVEEIKAEGLIGDFIARHQTVGLTPSAPAAG